MSESGEDDTLAAPAPASIQAGSGSNPEQTTRSKLAHVEANGYFVSDSGEDKIKPQITRFHE